jgi:hypothetical protein
MQLGQKSSQQHAKSSIDENITKSYMHERNKIKESKMRGKKEVCLRIEDEAGYPQKMEDSRACFQLLEDPSRASYQQKPLLKQ